MGITCGAFSRKTTLFSAHLGFAFRQLSTLKKMHQKMVVFGQCLASIPASMSSSEAIQPPQTDPAYMQQVTVLWSLCVGWHSAYQCMLARSWSGISAFHMDLMVTLLSVLAWLSLLKCSPANCSHQNCSNSEPLCCRGLYGEHRSRMAGTYYF